MIFGFPPTFGSTKRELGGLDQGQVVKRRVTKYNWEKEVLRFRTEGYSSRNVIDSAEDEHGRVCGGDRFGKVTR